MAEITKFVIKNFKGIQKAEIELSKKTLVPVVTLLGLNESGKTTILEALSKFVTVDSDTANLFTVDDTEKPESFIPKSKEAAFTGETSIEAHVSLNESDKDRIRKLIEARFNIKINTDKIENIVNIEARYTFEDSDLTDARNYWTGIEFDFLDESDGSWKAYVRPDPSSEDVDIWQFILSIISNRLPRLRYFPTFLVDIPSRIYLESFDGEGPTNKYYRQVLQDVLDSMDGDLSLKKHVVDRIKAYRTENMVDQWISMFMGDSKRSQIDSVFSKISNAISGEILGNWERVFQRKTNAKLINVTWNIDSGFDYRPYVEFSISDGSSNFSLNQRSLGFRWFFTFLLFTRFSLATKRRTIFLFDEPAANLHAKAQEELLDSFGKIVSDGNQIIYSTHSHHMIEPRWLTAAYIIENLAISYDSEDYFSVADTDIRSIKYHQFLSQSADRSSFYLPVLEKLKYSVPKVAHDKKLIVLEGISDFHLFSYVKRLEKITGFELVPGQSASNMGPLISYLIGLGAQFIIVLDDDKKGKQERDRYIKEWFLPEDKVVTLARFGDEFAGKKLENLVSSQTISKFASTEDKPSSPSIKKQLGMYFAECNYVGGRNKISDETRSIVSNILKQMREIIED